MSDYNEVLEILTIENPEALLADGFDEALIGVAQQFKNSVALYDTNKCIAILVDRDGMTEEEAIEYIDYNILGAYMGENAPIFCYIP